MKTQAINLPDVYHMVLKLEVSKGHLKWTISDLARFSKNSRTLIYYHLGKDKNEILHKAWDYMLETIFCLSLPENKGIKYRITEVVNTINSSPYLFVLFFLEKQSKSEIGDKIRGSENKLFELLKKHYPHYSSDDILRIYLMELGVVAYRPKDMKEVDFLFPK